ncbi:MAG: tRNA-(ms[2]io[6]A)-hydroxylase [Myxococcaceae bacterium]
MSSRKHRPLSGAGPVILKRPTSDEWIQLAVERFSDVLIDHAHCEKKAAANALSMMQAYPEIDGLPAQMARMAREESGHLARVLKMMEERGLRLTKDGGDPYAQSLQKLVRKTNPERRLDRLLIAAVIEARSCERLALLAEHLPEDELRSFYGELAQSEDGHQSLFFRLAAEAHGEDVAKERLEELLEFEAELIENLPVRAAVH